MVMFLTFTMMHFSGSNPVDIMVSQGSSADWPQQRIEALKEKFGFDKPFFEQLVDYTNNLLHGEFGRSIKFNRDVAPILETKVPISVQLGLAATFLVILFGVPLGVLAAAAHNRWPDTVILGTTMTLQAIPEFVLGPVLTVIFVLWLKILAVPVGWNGLFTQQSILPLAVLTIANVPIIIRQTRASMLEMAGSDYIRTARTKGLSERKILMKHMLRPALIPVSTTAGMLMTSLVNGAIFVEAVFNIPGLGNLTRDATLSLDYPLVMGVVIIITVLVMMGNLIVDLSYPLIDPRIRNR
ncbi:ABC transporter permease [Devosia rhodophyticola]